jgi:hypothetical protein
MKASLKEYTETSQQYQSTFLDSPKQPFLFSEFFDQTG